MRAVDDATAQALIAKYNAEAKVKEVNQAMREADREEMMGSVVLFVFGLGACLVGLYGLVQFVKWAWEH